MEKNFINFGAETSKTSERLAAAASGLIYISETDSDIVPFRGEPAEAVTREEILRQTGTAADEQFEEITTDSFFDKLTRIQDWFGDPEKERAARFAALYEEIKSSLTDLHVFRIGRVRIDIYVAGLDADGNLAGVKTFAVET